MNKTIADFLAEHDAFEDLLSTYEQAYDQAMAQDMSARAQDKAELSSALDEIQRGHEDRVAAADAAMSAQLDKLGEIDRLVTEREKALSQANLDRAKERRKALDIVGGSLADGWAAGGDDGWRYSHDDGSAGEADIQWTLSETLAAIDSIAGTGMAHVANRIVDLFEPASRRAQYDRVADAHADLSAAIRRQLDHVKEEHDARRSEADAETLEKIDALEQRRREMAAERDGESKERIDALVSTLSQGLAAATAKGTAYGDAADALAWHLSDGKGDAAPRPGGAKPGLLIGTALQPVTVTDDGTLDRLLADALPDGMYDAGAIMLPLVLPAKPTKPIFVHYFAEHVDGIYGLFESYARQLLRLRADDLSRIHLADCEHWGKRYAWPDMPASATLVDIVRTKELLSNDITAIWLRARTPTDGTAEGEHALFVSSLSELDNPDIARLADLAQSNRVTLFVGVSSDEMHESGVVPRSRAKDTQRLASLCEHLYLDSDGRLGLGNGRPQLAPPPQTGSG